MKQKFSITGMTCAACAARVEKAASSAEGVSSAAVSLPLNTLTVEGDFSPQTIVAAVEKAGYGCVGGNAAAKSENGNGTQNAVFRLLFSAVFLACLVYLNMGGMLSLPQPPRFAPYPLIPALLQLLLSGAVLVINGRFFTGGVKAVLSGAPDMDTLVCLGSGISYAYSVYRVFAMIALPAAEQTEILRALNFESAAMIPVFVSVGKLLEKRSKDKTVSALKNLMSMLPSEAVLIRSGEKVAVPVSEIRRGDIAAVKPGERFAADGTVISGNTCADESALTGESMPVEKNAGSRVYAGTVNLSGYAEYEITETEDTGFSKIIKTVEEAASSKAPVQKLADRVAAVFVPSVLGVALVTVAVHLLLGREFSQALSYGISVLVISCPCSLGLATPVAVTVGSGLGAKHGILFRSASALENISKCGAVFLDKTGTLTKGRPAVVSIEPYGISEDELLSVAASAEACSSHPLALAVAEYAEAKGIKTSVCSDFTEIPGRGVTAVLNGSYVCAGSFAFVSEHAEICAEETAGVFVCRDGKYCGMIAVGDELRPDSAEAVSQFKNMGLSVCMLTGDNETSARITAEKAGVGRVFASVLPENKMAAVALAQKDGAVIMVGDGINDAPALRKADIGMAVGAGTDVAVDCADVVLTSDRLTDAAAAVRLGRATLRVIRQNLFWAFGYNIIGIPLAAGCFSAFGLSINPMFGAACMSLSSVIVVLNALRLGRTDIYDTKKDKIIKFPKVKIMTTEMKIEGMMCAHCSGRVKKALEAADGVISAEVSHENGTAVVTASKDIPFAELKRIVEAEGYKVL